MADPGERTELLESDLEGAGPIPRTTPRPRGLPERVVVRRLHCLPGIEHWRVTASTRLWTAYHERYAFCVAHRAAGPQSWKYRRQTYGMQVGTSTALMAPGEVHATTLVHLASFQVLMIEPSVVKYELSDAPPTVCRQPSGGQTDKPAIARLFSSVCTAIESASACDFERRGVLREFLLAAFSADRDEPESISWMGCERAVARVRDIIHSRFSDTLSLEFLETEVNISKYYLERSFQAKIGVPIHRYLKLVRLARAQQRLRQGVPAIEVAPSAGFFDSAHMCRAFKAELGFTPGAYARAAR